MVTVVAGGGVVGEADVVVGGGVVGEADVVVGGGVVGGVVGGGVIREVEAVHGQERKRTWILLITLILNCNTQYRILSSKTSAWKY